MPSFLSKVFARKKDEKDASHKRTSAPSLLEGKFEAVSPPASPSAVNVTHAQPSQPAKREDKKEKEKDAGFSLFRTRSPRPTSPRTDAPQPELPHLTLSLAEEKGKETRQLGAVFETDAVDRGVLPDNVIGERRLSPHEALSLVKACSTAIADRGGLETLGVMHPHWYSASPDVQRKLISLFILSLATKSPSTLPASPTSPATLFNTELQYTRSPHDLAAVLRWALRHSRLEGDSFGIGSSSEPWKWYKSFSEAERAASYPSSAFSKFLTPQIPPAHLQLLLATLEIVSSLAAHSDYSGISGSKVAKLLGLWLLTTRRAEESDDWPAFYARWERSGRILEHLFLAQIRDDATHTQMPRRLVELVAGYPYVKGSIPEGDLLPRPRLSTRAFDALYVRLETQLPDFSVTKPKQSPLQVLADAVRAEGTTEAGEHAKLWDLLKQQAAATEQPALSTVDNGFPVLARAFTDETTGLLSKLPSVALRAELATIKLEIPEPRGRSRSVGAAKNGAANGTPRATASTTDLSPKDWTGFSSLGFGESALGTDFASTLMDNDVEVTEPPLVRRKSSRRKASSPPRAPADASSSSRTVTLQTKCASVKVVQIDEAFIDFWSDALLDPISGNFPSFVVCQLKPVAGLEANGKPLGWLVVEQVFTRPPPPPDPEPTSPVLLQRTASPRPSLRSNISARKSATFANAKKRFTLFSSKETIESLDSKLATRKRAGKTPKIGEMGEILVEEPETQQSEAEEQKPDLPSKGPEPVNAEAATGVAAATGTAAANVNADLPPVPIVEADAPVVEAAAAVEPVKASDEPAEKPTKFVEHITPPTNSSPASSAVVAPADDAESKELPPAPGSVVLAGETPGPDVALSTSEPIALAEAYAHAAVAESTIAEETQPETAPQSLPVTTLPAAQPAVEEIPISPQTAEPVDDIQASAVSTETRDDVAPTEPEEDLPAAAPVQTAPAGPGLEPPLPEVSAHVEAVAEPPVPATEPEPEVVPAEEEPVAEPTSVTEGAVAEPTTVEGAVTENEPAAEPESVERTQEPVVLQGLETVVNEEPVASVQEETATSQEVAISPPVEQAAVVEESTILSPPQAEVTAAEYHVSLPSEEDAVEHADQAAGETQTQNGSAHHLT